MFRRPAKGSCCGVQLQSFFCLHCIYRYCECVYVCVNQPFSWVKWNRLFQSTVYRFRYRYYIHSTLYRFRYRLYVQIFTLYFSPKVKGIQIRVWLGSQSQVWHVTQERSKLETTVNMQTDKWVSVHSLHSLGKIPWLNS